MREIDVQLRRLAERQHSLVSRAQAVELGFTDQLIARRVRSGVLQWEIPHHVLAVPGAPRTWRRKVMAAVLAGGPGCAASHRTAAALWELSGASPGLVEITVPLNRRLVLPGVVVHRKKDLGEVDVTTTSDGIAVTTVARTLVDLGAMWGVDRLQEAIDDAARRGLTSLSRVIWRVSKLRRRGRRGVRRVVAALTADPEGPVRSVLERRFVRVLARAGLPAPERQFAVRLPDGRVAHLDFAFVPLMLAIEVDGHGSHATRAERRSDNRRENELRLLGWTVLRFTYEQVCFEPEDVASVIARALADRRPRAA